ncbi:MAG: large conductance mechanosensitive channel protein MscL [Saprospiraceae bacterium]|nr:large conductance mechanosensitive channel protein MscL [Saprospiraceae bacterium]MBK8633166.1 large conductance mechanosensitive channel protein MscL [Saprospiraceae bacterium]MBP7642329.1 large conductance mechanosensitive channel protein MscL [Saprospiraceae bacterium]HMS67400.1 large conductance mechanosensitive channel protein MscL [Saprospiraceae bacterium]
MIKEFKDFIMKGNVLDLAVAVIIGGAFGKIISSLVEDIITPLILKPSLEAAGVASIEEWAPGGIFLGKFLGAAISFLVIAFVMFLIIKSFNKLNKPAPAEPAAPAGPTETELLIQIRDLLKK